MDSFFFSRRTGKSQTLMCGSHSDGSRWILVLLYNSYDKHIHNPLQCNPTGALSTCTDALQKHDQACFHGSRNQHRNTNGQQQTAKTWSHFLPTELHTTSNAPVQETSLLLFFFSRRLVVELLKTEAGEGESRQVEPPYRSENDQLGLGYTLKNQRTCFCPTEYRRFVLRGHWDLLVPNIIKRFTAAMFLQISKNTHNSDALLWSLY